MIGPEREIMPRVRSDDPSSAEQLPLHRAIYEELLREIRSGEYGPGDRLPSEAVLCERFDASRITVAKAIQGLQRDDLVVRRPGSGTYIQTPQRASSRQFGLLIPDLGGTEIFEPICRGIMRSPLAKTHALVWGHAPADENGREQSAEDLCRQFISQKLAGVFFAPLEYIDGSDMINHKIVAALDRANIPVVLLDRCYKEYPLRSTLDLVGIDNHRAGIVLTQHLWRQGARRIVFVARKLSASTMIERISGYSFALHEQRAEFASVVLYGDVTDERFVRSMIEKHRPDGIVCGNDLTAARLMRTLIGLGMRVPEEVSMVGIDDVSYAKFLPVPLTTIHQNCDEIGEVAMALMLERLRHPQRAAMDVRVRFELIVRESCGALLAPRSSY
jgi:GntR family transcriptional regulator, arabinose operon transcriptional repressor